MKASRVQLGSMDYGYDYDFVFRFYITFFTFKII